MDVMGELNYEIPTESTDLPLTLLGLTTRFHPLRQIQMVTPY